jgi:hypothetical protein
MPEPSAGSAPPVRCPGRRPTRRPGGDLDVDERRTGMFDRVGQGFGHDVVAGEFDRVGQPSLQAQVEADGDGGAVGQHLEGLVEPAPGEAGRVDAAGELTELVQRTAEPDGHSVQLGRQVAVVGWYGGLDGPQLERQRDQLLLSAIVQVTLDAAAGGVAGGHDPRP